MNFAKVFKQMILALVVFSAPMTFANDVEMEFVSISAGKFTMGNAEDEPYVGDEKDQIEVQLNQDFEMQITEVTQLQWFRVMKDNPSLFKEEKYCRGEYRIEEEIKLCPNHPVEHVSWDRVQDFIAILNKKNDGYIYRLPTEEEWEYAARAGSVTIYSFGGDASELSDYGWYWENSDKQTHVVKLKKANSWGLHDMHGNVWEWTSETYDARLLKGRTPVVEVDPSDSKYYRVARGGAWSDNAMSLYSVSFGFGHRDVEFRNVGLRLVRTPVTP